MYKLFPSFCFAALVGTSATASAQTIDQPALAELKTQIDVAGIKLGMPAEDARRALESASPKLILKSINAGGPKRMAGWIAKRDTPACKREALGCEEIVRVESLDGKVFLVAHNRSFAPGQDAPTVDAVRRALSERYGALVSSVWSSAPQENIIEYGFETDGTQHHEACVAISEKGPGGQWLYGFTSQCDWVFNTELARYNNGTVRTVDVLLGDARAAYEVLGGINGEHKRALAALVGRQRDREVVIASRPH